MEWAFIAIFAVIILGLLLSGTGHSGRISELEVKVRKLNIEVGPYTLNNGSKLRTEVEVLRQMIDNLPVNKVAVIEEKIQEVKQLIKEME